MTEVLLVVALVPPERALADGIARFRELGCGVTVLAFPNVDAEALGLAPEEVRFLRTDVDTYGAAFWREMYAEGRFSKRVWTHVEADAWSMARSRGADVLVAVDSHAVFSVWNLARRNKTAEARLGIEPGIAAARRITESGAARRPSPSTGSATPEAPAPKGLRARVVSIVERRPALLRRFAASARVPEPLRFRFARAALDDLGERGQQDAARRLAARVLSTTDDRFARANLLGDVIADDLASGRDPVVLKEAVTAELAVSDLLWDRDDKPLAAGSFMQAARIAFHRAPHFDSVSSPLAADPVGFTESLRASTIFRNITEAQGRQSPPRAAEGGTTKVLIAHQDNPNFLREVIDSLAGPDVEIIVTDPGELAGTGNWARNSHAILRSLAVGDGRAAEMAEENLRPILDWADVVFVEWCSPLACAFTLIDPGTTKIVVRLHSFEAFSLWPHFVDYSRVDTMVFVSEHLRDFVERAVPRLQRASTERLVIPNGVNLRTFAADKAPAARFNVGLVGLSSIAKDVRWALEVVRRLRAQDDRYRLLLVGDDLPEPASAAGRRYREAYHRELADLEAAGAAVRIGQVDDVKAVLEDIGVILSTSVRESQHLGLLEGAASGAVPVVRDWPFFAGMEHGPRTLFPAEWVVETPDQAVERVLGSTRSEEVWRRLGAEASRIAIERFDIATHHADYQKLLTT